MSSIQINGDTSGSVSLVAPSVSGTTTLTLPASTGTIITDASTTGINASALSTGTVGTARLASGTASSSTYLRGDSTWSAISAASITSGTPVASTSGTSITFSSIPAGVKIITMMFNGISTNSTSPYLVQIGSGSVTTSGYASCCSDRGGETTATNGFLISRGQAATVLSSGQIILSLIGSNTWVASSILTSGSGSPYFAAGNSSALSGALDRIVLTTTTGTDTFDAGTVNIIYEG